MDYPDEILAELDFVVGSIHTGFTQTQEQLTRRMTTAMRNRYVTIIAHPTGRLMGQRDGYAIDLAAAYAVAAQPRRLDLTDTAARAAREAGVMLAICTDTHGVDQLEHMALGLGVARRAWLEPQHLLNCMTLPRLLAWIAKKRTAR
jgi:DNA polymerase (family 10)